MAKVRIDPQLAPVAGYANSEKRLASKLLEVEDSAEHLAKRRFPRTVSGHQGNPSGLPRCNCIKKP